MSLLFQDKELIELMRDFYTLTGIKIVLFDVNFNELFSYPTTPKTFCSQMRLNESYDLKCKNCDEEAFKRCKNSKSLEVYKCQAGMTEAVSPIIEGDNIIGYMMFGEVTDNRDKQDFFESMSNYIKPYSNVGNINGLIKKIKYKSNKQILAAAKILDALTEYILLKEIVQFSDKQIIEKIDIYIENNLNGDVSIGALCKEFKIGRTKLYEVVKEYANCGIASYLKQKRLKRAKHLLKTTDMKISEISDTVGFSDYNYFLRVFKQEFGISPKHFFDNNHKKQNSI